MRRNYETFPYNKNTLVSHYPSPLCQPCHQYFNDVVLHAFSTHIVNCIQGKHFRLPTVSAIYRNYNKRKHRVHRTSSSARGTSAARRRVHLEYRDPLDRLKNQHLDFPIFYIARIAKNVWQFFNHENVIERYIRNV